MNKISNNNTEHNTNTNGENNGTSSVIRSSLSFWLDRRTIVALALSMLTLAEIVDLTIVAVALPHIMGALNCNINQVSLTMTSYIVASAVFIPLTGFVSKKYGSKKVSLISAVVFGIASILCGMANTLVTMVIFRLIQGIGGAFLPAMSQAYITEHFTPQEKPKIMTVFSLCVVLGPIIGPLFGGFIVEHANWRWIFYVNVPICLLALTLIAALMQESQKETIKTDYVSFLFMMIGIGCLEYFLDEGNQNNWLQSQTMLILLTTGTISVVFFIWRGLLGKSIINFDLFRDKNFNLSCLVVFLFVIAIALTLAYFPTMLQQGYGYPVDLAGYITAPRGVCSLLAAPVFVLLSKYIDPRKVMASGILFFAIASWLLCHYGASQNPHFILLTCLIQGIGITGTFVILTQAAFAGLPKNLSSDGAGVFNFFRNIGNSVGTSIAATIIARVQQISWHDMASNINNQSANYNTWFASKLPTMHGAYNMHNVLLKANLASLQIQSQSFLIANLDVFFVAFLVLCLLLWVPFVLNKPHLDNTHSPYNME